MSKNKKLIILILFAALLFSGVFLFKSSGSGAKILWELSDGGKWLLPLIISASLIDSINPCAFSVLILTIAFLFSIGKLRSKIIQIGGFYIFGIFTIYILIGLGILQALHIFNTPHFMAKLGASLLIILGGINIINDLFPAFPLKLRIPHFAHHRMAELMEKGSVPTAFILGALVGLCEFPCTGGPYLMVLGLLHDKITYLKGLIYLLIYNIVFISPLVIILLLAGNFALPERIKIWQQSERSRMRLSGGIAMVILGILIFLL